MRRNTHCRVFSDRWEESFQLKVEQFFASREREGISREQIDWKISHSESDKSFGHHFDAVWSTYPEEENTHEEHNGCKECGQVLSGIDRHVGYCRRCVKDAMWR